MSALRWSAAATLGFALGACTPQATTGLEVTVTFDGALDQLAVTFSADGADGAKQNVPEKPKALKSGDSAAFLLPDDLIGKELTIVVDGLHNQDRVARGSGKARVGRGEVGTASIKLATLEEPAPVCGDGAVGQAEACDDDNTAAGDGCDADCNVEDGFVCSGDPSVCARCGDGVVVAGAESCDDDNNDPGDGCDAACTEEPGYHCAGAPSVCEAECGDGVAVANEQCDTGAARSDSVADACRTDCTNPRCGDLVTDAGEQCDDGNEDNGDGCRTTCQAPGCGDGIDDGEACDDGDVNSGDGCSSTCTVEAGFACGGEPAFCVPSAEAHTVAPSGGAFTQISAAVVSPSVADGDTLFIAAGTYGPVDDNGKDLHLVGGPGVVIRSSSNNQDAMRVHATADITALGITFEATCSNGCDAIQVDGQGSSLVLVNCVVGPADAKGINTTGGTDIVVQRTRVFGAEEGAIFVDGTYTIENSVIVDNAGTIGGVDLRHSGTFRFNTVARNSHGGGPDDAGGVHCAQSTTLEACIVFDNNGRDSTGACDVSTSLVGVDPLFSADGFHITAASPAHDAGGADCPADDFDGDPRPLGAACEQGADERP